MAKPQYGHAHRKRRATLLPQAIGKPCPLCGQPMLPTQQLDLDHTVPYALGGTVGDRICHARCNRSRGAALGNRMRARRRPPWPSSGSV